MVHNANIVPTAEGSHQVIAYKELTCPACGRLLCEIDGNITIDCRRCGARVRHEKNKSTIIRAPRKVAGKMLLDGVERLIKDMK